MYILVCCSEVSLIFSISLNGLEHIPHTRSKVSELRSMCCIYLSNACPIGNAYHNRIAVDAKTASFIVLCFIVITV